MRRGVTGNDDGEGLGVLKGEEEDIRARALAAGAAALGPSGDAAPRAMDLLWEYIVGWDPDLTSQRGIEFNASLSRTETH